MRLAAGLAAALALTIPSTSDACTQMPMTDAQLDAAAAGIVDQLLDKAAFVGIFEIQERELIPELFELRKTASGGRDYEPGGERAFAYAPPYAMPARFEFRTIEALLGSRSQFEAYAFLVQPYDAQLRQDDRPLVDWANHPEWLMRRTSDLSDRSQLPTAHEGIDLRAYRGPGTCDVALAIREKNGGRYLAFVDKEGWLLPNPGALELLNGADDPWLARVQNAISSRAPDAARQVSYSVKAETSKAELARLNRLLNPRPAWLTWGPIAMMVVLFSFAAGWTLSARKNRTNP